jgi:DNA (cytosine-5)-methyltransferase 1
VIPVIDLFAGPGGLGEGFSSLESGRNKRVFKIALSIEMEEFAHKTLVLRSFFRQFPRSKVPEEYYETLRGKITTDELYKAYATEAEAAALEAWRAKLGEENPDEVDKRITRALENNSGPWVLIGGPPCQAYSLVGRSRRKSDPDFQNDDKHFLYKQYLRILANHRPHIFVMENVKGILSSTIKGKKIVDRIISDLKEPGLALNGKSKSNLRYNLYPLAESQVKLFEGQEPRPSDFIIRTEEHGIPQMRHRFILLGVRSDLSGAPDKLAARKDPVKMWQVIKDLPPLRSQLSKEEDSPAAWCSAIRQLSLRLRSNGNLDGRLRTAIKTALDNLLPGTIGAPFMKWPDRPMWQQDWYFDERLGGVCNHESRGHIREDLWRYLYAACFAAVEGHSPVLSDFPSILLPNHDNVPKRDFDEDVPFADRFRVQVKDRPSTTITSHISKDGHYFIHPEPNQCRSLTVREAARLQTFPDNYFFLGGRTAQYQQVGNAVPPLLAAKIAERVAELIKTIPD